MTLEEIIGIVDKKINSSDLNTINFYINRILFNSYYNSLYNNTKNRQITSDFQNIFNYMQNYKINTSLNSGISGIGVLVHYNKHLLSDSFNILDLFNFIVTKDVTDQIENNYFKNHRDYDIFNGILGKLIFLIHDTNKNSIILEKYINFVSKSLKELNTNYSNNILFTMSNNFINKDLVTNYPNGYLDLGCAHGLSSILASLLILRNYGFNVEHCIKIIIQFYKNLINKIDYQKNLFYNKRYYKDFNSPYSPSWCYGDLGIACTLSHLNEKEKSSGILKYIDFSKKTAKKLLSLNLIKENHFCHGRTGVKYLLNIYDPNNLNDFVINIDANYSYIDGYLSELLPLLDLKFIDKQNCIFSKMILNPNPIYY